MIGRRNFFTAALSALGGALFGFTTGRQTMPEPRLRYGRIGSPSGVILEDELGADALSTNSAGNAGKFLDKFGAFGNLRAYGATGDGVTDDRAAFVAVETAGDHGLAPAGTYLIGSNITLSKAWTFTRGAKLKPASGVVVTIPAGSFRGHLAEHFDLSLGGTVSFAGTETVFPQWWGATGLDAAVDTPAVKNAVAAIANGGVILLTRKFRLNDTPILTSFKSLKGYNRNICGLQWYGTAGSGTLVQIGAGADGNAESTSGVRVSDLSLESGSGAPAIGIDNRSGKWTCSIENCYIEGRASLHPNYTGTGIKMGGFTFGIRIHGNDIERWAVGIDVDSVSNTNWITQNTINNNRIGVRLGESGEAATNWVIANNLFELNVLEAINSSGANAVEVSGNRFEANGATVGSSGTTAQIYLRNPNGWEIHGNYFTVGSGAIAQAIHFFGVSGSSAGNRNFVHSNTESSSGPHSQYFVACNAIGLVEIGRNKHSTPNEAAGVYETEKRHRAKARGSTSSVPNSTLTPLDLTATLVDDDAIVDLTNNEFVFRRTMDGIATVTIQWAANATGFRSVLLQHVSADGLTETTIAQQSVPPVSGNTTILNVTSPVSVVTGERLRVKLFQNSGAALNIELSGESSPTLTFQATRIGYQA